ncbi:MAG: S9 family peptidase [Alphaproteobacteria bacterium]|nr:S9 family peptidase [Alphaproteobacteria bacterium]
MMQLGPATEASARAAPVALSVAAQGPDFNQLRIAPDGGTLSAVVPGKDGGKGLAFYTLPDLRPLGRLDVGRYSQIRDHVWVSNDRVLIEVKEVVVYGGAPVNTGQLYAVNKDGSAAGIVYGYAAGEAVTGTRIRGAKTSRAWGSIVHALPEDPRHALILEEPFWDDPRRRDGERISLMKLDVLTGEKVVIPAPPRCRHVIIGPDGVPKVAMVDADEGYSWLVRGEDRAWHPAPSGAEPLSDIAVPMGADEHAFYVIDSVDEQPEALIRVDLTTGAKTVVSSRRDQVPYFVYRRPGGAPAAVGYEWPYPQQEVLPDAGAYGEALEALSVAFPAKLVQVVSSSADARFHVVWVASDREPGSWYLFDKAAGQVVKLIDAYKDVAATQVRFGPREAFTVSPPGSPDLVLTGYLTFPAGAEERRAAPTVVLVHGGPMAQDLWAFDAEAQYLASLGYLVLQVNFRGSTGRGKAFEKLAYREWAGKVQDDILAAVDWGIAEGLVDRDHVCIYGGSFGGYSAMMSVIRFPDRYRCAVGISGLYDLSTWGDEGDVGAYGYGREYLKEALGEDEGALRAQSPLHLAERIKVPVLLVHGDRDERTPIGPAKDLARAIEARGGDVIWAEFKGEGHGLRTSEHRRGMLEGVSVFLHEHLVGTSTTSASP